MGGHSTQSSCPSALPSQAQFGVLCAVQGASSWRKKLEPVQRRAAKMVEGLLGVPNSLAWVCFTYRQDDGVCVCVS